MSERRGWKAGHRSFASRSSQTKFRFSILEMSAAGLVVSCNHKSHNTSSSKAPGSSLMMTTAFVQSTRLTTPSTTRTAVRVMCNPVSSAQDIIQMLVTGTICHNTSSYGVSEFPSFRDSTNSLVFQLRCSQWLPRYFIMVCFPFTANFRQRFVVTVRCQFSD